jgi:MFS family permease
MVYPLLPSFLINELGASGAVLGVMEGVAAGLVSFLTIYIGWRSDVTNQRVRFVRMGYGLAVFGKISIALATSSWWIFVGRVVDRIGKGIRTSPRDALIAGSVGAESRGRVFGFHRSMVSLGSVIGVAISWIALYVYEGHSTSGGMYSCIFFISVLFAFFSLIATSFLGEYAVPVRGVSEVRQFRLKDIGGLGQEYWKVVGLIFLFSFANSSDAFILLRLSEVVGSTTNVVLGYGLYRLVYMLAAYPAGILSDRFGKWRSIVTGWMVYSLVYFGFSLELPGSCYWLFLALYGLYLALTEAAIAPLVVRHVGDHQRGTALGVLYFFVGLSAVTSNAISGFLLDYIGIEAPFVMGGVIALIALITTLVLVRDFDE